MDPNEVDPSLQILFHGPQDSTQTSHAQITPSNFYSSSTGGQEKEEGTAESLGEKRERRSTIHFDEAEGNSPQANKRPSRTTSPATPSPQTATNSFEGQLASLLLSVIDKGSIDWNSIAQQLAVYDQDSRQLQALWRRWKEEMKKPMESNVEVKWTKKEDAQLRASVEEIGAVIEGEKSASSRISDENLAKWVWVRDRLGKKRVESLSSIVKRWKKIGRSGMREVFDEGVGASMDVGQDGELRAVIDRVPASFEPDTSKQDQQESSGRIRSTTTALRSAVTTPSLQTSAVSSHRKTPSSTSPEPVSSTTTSTNTTSLPHDSTSGSELPSRTLAGPFSHYTKADDATLCRMLSEGNFHKDIAKVLSRSTVSINQRVLKLRGKGVLPQSSRRGGLQSNVVEDALRGAPPVVVAPSLGQIIDATPSRSSLPLASFTPPVSIDQVPFSPEDERLILQLHSTLPGQFKKISRQMQPIRHKKEVRERYEELIASRERSSSPDSSSDDNRSSRHAPRSSAFTLNRSRLRVPTSGPVQHQNSTPKQLEDAHDLNLRPQTDSRRTSIVASNKSPSFDHTPPTASSSRQEGTQESTKSPIPAPWDSPKRKLVDFSTETDPLPPPRPRKRRYNSNDCGRLSRPRKLSPYKYEHLLESGLAALKELYECGEQGLKAMEMHRKAKGKKEDSGKETVSLQIEGKN